MEQSHPNCNNSDDLHLDTAANKVSMLLSRSPFYSKWDLTNPKAHLLFTQPIAQDPKSTIVI